ncbi:hypothetical protein A1S_3838 [Acinetobacter baumannii ATCC 17978]|nr:hypothetical protein A1S_3838 [Acinetobacter baumannii ATCC 17978]
MLHQAALGGVSNFENVVPNFDPYVIENYVE